MVEDLVPESLWERVAPLLPARPPRRYRFPGRRPVEDRVALAGIVFVLNRDHRERAADRGDRLLGGDLLAPDARLDRSRGVARAARAAARRATRRRDPRPRARRGGRLARARPQRGDHVGPSPVNRGHAGAKHHLIVEGHGLPLAVLLTGGHRHDVTQLMALLDAVPPIRGVRGRPRRRPRELYADRGYDFDKYRRLLRQRGIRPRIARRGTAHGSGLGQVRWVVERAFAWLHGFKRLRTRHERRADIHLGLLQLACALICHRQLVRSF